MNRTVFPPTPPPESEKGQSAISPASAVTRGPSFRSGQRPAPLKLNIEKPLPTQRYEVKEEPPKRLPTQRSMSEARGPSQAHHSRTRTLPFRRRPSNEEGDDEYPSDVYGMYRNSQNGKSTLTRPRNQPRFIEEEDEYVSDYGDDAFDENDFEIVSSRPAPLRTRALSRNGSGRTSSRRPEIRKIRVKVHAAYDTRYLMISSAIEFSDLKERVREKFELRGRFKLKIRDDDMPDGDMITMGDQDDLEMALMTVKATAKKERQDMGKMEVGSA